MTASLRKRTQNHPLLRSFLGVLYPSGHFVDRLILHGIPGQHFALIFADKSLHKDGQVGKGIVRRDIA